MSPTLKSGQIVWCLQTRDFKIGQIVIAFVKNKEVIKRISKIENGFVWLSVDDKKHAHNGKYYAKINDRHVEAVVIWPRKI